MTIMITFADVRRTVDEIVSEVGPDFRYIDTEYCDFYYGCTYVHPRVAQSDVEDIPGCLVGRILFKLGVPLHAMREMNNNTGVESLSEYLESSGYIDYPDGYTGWMIRRYLTELQDAQDNGTSWVIARARADRWHIAELMYKMYESAEHRENCTCPDCQYK